MTNNENTYIDQLSSYKEASWGITNVQVGDEMDEISDFITDGDISGKYSALLVFEELYVNVAKYAYPDKKGALFVRVISSEKGIEMLFIDAGIPFDPTHYKPSKEQEEDKCSVGGHGIELVIDCSQKISYKRDMGLNILYVLV